MPRAHPTASSGYLHEMPSQQRAMSGVVERSVRVMSHAELASELAAAFTAFRTARPRARYIEVPLDLLAERAEATVPEPQHAGAPSPAPAALAAALELLRGAERPGIVAGGGSAGAPDALRALAERLGAPVITTANGKGVLPEDHELSLGAQAQLPRRPDVARGVRRRAGDRHRAGRSPTSGGRRRRCPARSSASTSTRCRRTPTIPPRWR